MRQESARHIASILVVLLFSVSFTPNSAYAYTFNYYTIDDGSTCTLIITASFVLCPNVGGWCNVWGDQYLWPDQGSIVPFTIGSNWPEHCDNNPPSDSKGIRGFGSAKCIVQASSSGSGLPSHVQIGDSSGIGEFPLTISCDYSPQDQPKHDKGGYGCQ